jgi:hypothetical protein
MESQKSNPQPDKTIKDVLSFNGDSQNLHKTIVVPTLDASIDGHNNVVWCASFLAAWKILETDVAKEPPALQGSPEASLGLNQASDPRPHIPRESIYAAAGWNQEGITDRIRKDLARKFPAKTPPTFTGILPNSFVAYAYLEANVKFSLPYLQNRASLVFTDHEGKKTELSSFGIRPEDYGDFELRRQPEILYVAKDKNNEPVEFIVDLDRTSTPNQIILALVDPKPTLEEVLATVEDKIDTHAEVRATVEDKINTLVKMKGHNGLDSNDLELLLELDSSVSAVNKLGVGDVLLVPEMVWRIEHHFAELEGQEFTNSKLKSQRIDIFQQDTKFSLDRYGASLSSEAKSLSLGFSEPTYYVFDRPFLLYMKKQGANMPYFVMWVGNAELLKKWQTNHES